MNAKDFKICAIVLIVVYDYGTQCTSTHKRTCLCMYYRRTGHWCLLDRWEVGRKLDVLHFLVVANSSIPEFRSVLVLRNPSILAFIQLFADWKRERERERERDKNLGDAVRGTVFLSSSLPGKQAVPFCLSGKGILETQWLSENTFVFSVPRFPRDHYLLVRSQTAPFCASGHNM